MKKILIFSITFLLYSYSAFSQHAQNNVIASAGGTDTAKQYLVSWTIGEPVVATYGNVNNILTQGFQQSFFIISEIPEVKIVMFEVNVFPNPTSDFINIDIQSALLERDYDIELSDIQGHTLRKYKANNNSVFQIDLRFISATTVVMKVIHKASNSHRIFKIVKTN